MSGWYIWSLLLDRGAVFFGKRPGAVETINDLDGDIVNLFRVLRSGRKNSSMSWSLPHTVEKNMTDHLSRVRIPWSGHGGIWSGLHRSSGQDWTANVVGETINKRRSAGRRVNGAALPQQSMRLPPDCEGTRRILSKSSTWTPCA